MTLDTIFYTQIGSIIGFIVALFVLYRLLVHQKDATIELLREKNQWLESQLEQSKTTAPDTLIDKLQKRIDILHGELERLGKDTDRNEIAIREKEDEIERTKKLLESLENEVEKQKERYEELYFQLDLCPYCESNIIELTNVDEREYSGTYRAYACGYAEMDGEVYGLCPHDSNYPEFDEFEFDITFNKQSDIWIGHAKPKTDRAKRIQFSNEVGGSKEEVEKLFRDAYIRRRSKNPNWIPAF
jgi:hypothetical protein